MAARNRDTRRCVQTMVDHAELRAILGASAGVVIMCPDSANTAARETLNVAFSELNPKKHRVAVAESFGGNDEPIDKLTRDLIGLGIDPISALRMKADPTEQVRCRCRHPLPDRPPSRSMQPPPPPTNPGASSSGVTPAHVRT